MDTTTVTICAEQSSFTDIASELVNYLAVSLFATEEEQVSFIQGFSTEGEDDKALFDRILAEVKGFGQGASDAQVEGFFNLLLSTIFSLYPPPSPEFSERLLKLVSIVSFSPATSESTKILQYQILSTIHNILPPTSSLRPSVFLSLLSVASKNGDVAALGLTSATVEAWVAGWREGGVEEAEIVKVLDAIVAALNGSPSQFTFSLLALSLITPAPAQIISTTATALSLKSLFDLKPLLSIKSVVELKSKSSSDAIWQAVDVFVSGSSNDAKAISESELSAAGVDVAAYTHKLKLLTLTSLCASTTSTASRELSYAQVAKVLELKTDPLNTQEVENWVIEAISLGLLTAKLSQPTSTLRVQTAYIRSFGKAEWTALRARLVEWQTNLGSVLSVLHEAGGIEAAITGNGAAVESSA